MHPHIASFLPPGSAKGPFVACGAPVALGAARRPA